MARLATYIKFTSISLLVSVTCLSLMNYNQHFVIIASKHRSRNLRWFFGTDEDDTHRHHHLNLRPVKTKTQYIISVSAPYIINNPNVCRKFEKVSSLIMVHTAPDHILRREKMRRTWLNRTHYSPENVLVIFLLGTVKNQTLQQALVNESKKHGDIIQGDFIDSYRNLTNKGVMGYRWITENCRNAEIVIKIDDDAFINMFKFFEDYSYLKEREKFIYCNKINKNSMPILRDHKSKWYVNEYEYKDIKVFPHPYCSGFVVFLSIDLVPPLYHAAIGTPFFWVDDFFLFGLLPSRVKNVQYEKYNGTLTFSHPEGLKCYKEKGRNCQYLIVPARENEIDVLWKTVIKDRTQSIYGNYYMHLKKDTRYVKSPYT
ncbi:hypothetical protein FSP39_011523 [Pinctada imbricata]|uniref:Hexosyltransferase n=1 Tax=Pinctada imbricata TaxID=66713 RepID=A0AA88XWC5_PINIB|nr:hypothetical protein FSP39_011523 [Pinctada imbricata]